MADAELNALSAIGSLADLDLLYAEDVSANAGVKVTLNQLVAYIEQRGRQHNSSVAAQTPAAATDVYIVGSDVLIPDTRIQAKSKYKLELSITKGAAGTGTPTVTIRVGTAGSTADAARLTFTWPAANTAVADEMKLTIFVTFRTVGSGTTAVIEGMMLAEHELTTTGFGGTALGSNIIVNATSAGFDSTVSNLRIGCSINGGTASAWTIRQAQAILENLA